MIERYSFLQRKVTGKVWRAGHTVYGLCAAWNHATSPSRPMFEYEHVRSRSYAKAIRNRMNRLGFAQGRHYRELSTGSLWPIADRA